MGIYYHPTAQGMNDGRRIGLKNEKIWVHMFLDLKDIEEEFKVLFPYATLGAEYYLALVVDMKLDKN